MSNKDIRLKLEQDAQIIVERIPMSATRKDVLEIAGTLKALMQAEKWSQATVAKKLGIGLTTVNHFLAGKYKGNVARIANKVANLINSTARKKRRPRGPEFVETTVAKKIQTLITQASSFSDDEGKAGIIIGDGGHGKSHCLRHYAEANQNTVYAELDQAMHSKLIFAEIAKALRIDESGSLADVTRRLIVHLQNKELIVILDEASNLTVKQLDQLRQVIMVKARCPLILAGNGDLLKTIMQPTSRRGFESLDQFTSRLMAILDLNDAAARTDGGLYTTSDLRALYEYGGIRLAGDAVATLRKICRTPRSGRMRTSSLLITALHTSPVVIKEKQITAATILACIEDLRLPVKVWLPMEVPDEIEQQEQAAAKAG